MDELYHGQVLFRRLEILPNGEDAAPRVPCVFEKHQHLILGFTQSQHDPGFGHPLPKVFGNPQHLE